MENNKNGSFDSWEIISANVARKYCDISFFKYRGSGLPKEVRWFFDAEALSPGNRKDLNLIFEEKTYDAYIQMETEGLGRTRIFWEPALAEAFAPYNKEIGETFLEFRRGISNQFFVEFKKIDLPAGVGKGNMKEVLNKFMDGYLDAKKEPFGSTSFYQFLRDDIPATIYETGLVDKKDFLVSGRAGAGNWAMVPWIAIFYKSITTRATTGVYIVYLLSKDTKRLYLTFNQGCSDIRATHSKKETIAIMREKARDLQTRIDSRGFLTDENINLGENLTELAELYQRGTIFYKEYQQGEVPEDAELYQDLSKMMEIYKDYIAIWSSGNKDDTKINDLPGLNKMEELSKAEAINRIKSYVLSKGFNCDKALIENIYLSLRSKPFVILAGVSGTGKSWITRLFAEAIGAGDNYEMISVRPDWSDASELLGYVNLDGKFIPGMLTSVIEKASQPGNEDKIYFVCLDEMNLARVEYYFSDFLSVIETREWSGARIATRKIFKENSFGPDSDNEYHKRYGALTIPDNVYLIGTVNMDETTHPFSKKVLDRANTIELSEINLRAEIDQNGAEENSGIVKPLALENGFLRSKYLDFRSCYSAHPEEMNQMIGILESINKALQSINAQIAYRVRNEIAYYLSYAIEDNLLTFEQAMDNALMQKILPRIQGEGHRIQKGLAGILDAIIPGMNFSKEDDLLVAIDNYLKTAGNSCLYSKSIRKITFMLEGIRNNGYATYWL